MTDKTRKRNAKPHRYSAEHRKQEKTGNKVCINCGETKAMGAFRKGKGYDYVDECGACRCRAFNSASVDGNTRRTMKNSYTKTSKKYGVNLYDVWGSIERARKRRQS